MSITLWIVARFSPIEWKITKPPPCDSHNGEKIHRNRNERGDCKCDNFNDGNGDGNGDGKALAADAHNSVNDNLTYFYSTGESFNGINGDAGDAGDAGDEEAQLLSAPRDDDNSNNYSSDEEVIIGERDINGFRIFNNSNEIRNGDRKSSDGARSECLVGDFCGYHDRCDDVAPDEVHNCDFIDCDGLEETQLLSSENEFTLKNSFWFTIGTLMQQGSDLNPKVLQFISICFRFDKNEPVAFDAILNFPL